MTPPTGPRDDRFERSVRQAHDAALAHVPPRTLARLRPRNEAAPARAWRPGWALATACVAVFAAALGARALLAPPDAAPAPVLADAGAAAAATDLPALPEGDLLVALDEDPDLFLWLASSEARPLAME
ncbi:hypothetical protein LDO32_18370 [Luteimonas sp. Y-2-2-4F]|nr:hypothetical protein [Luteimonas sp. Y-2-2-4F]MCD9033680.1 hypothetical protein [Luteimonas sp. Y-2-2-4F]